MTLAVLLTTLLLHLFASACAVSLETKYQFTLVSLRRAYSRGEIKEALAFYESEAQRAEKNAAASLWPQASWEDASRAYRMAAFAASYAGQLQKSITHAEKALEMAEKTKDPHLRLSAINRVIGAYTSVRNFGRARDFIDKSFEIVKEFPPNSNPRVEWEGILYGELGRNLGRQRDYDKAIDAWSQSLYLKQQYLASLYGWSKQNQSLIENARGNIIYALNGLGDAYRLAGRHQGALEQFQRALSHIKEWGIHSSFEGMLVQNLGELYLQQKKFSEALENFKIALEFGGKRQSSLAVGRANRRIGDILRQTGKPAEAIPYYQKAIQQTESTRSLLESEEYRQSFFEGALGSYINVMRVLLLAGKQEEAFNYSERARSRVFLDVLGSKVQLSRVMSGLFEEERALQERIAAIKAKLTGEEEGEAARGGLGKELQEAETAYNAFLSKVRKQDKEQASLMTVEPLTLKQVQELLDPGTTLIEYFVTGPNILVWVVEKDKVQHVRVRLEKKELSHFVKTFRETIFSLGEKEKFNEVSAALYKHLIQPLLSHVSGKELIIVPHDVLHYLPFHALVSAQGRYLIEDYPIYYLSSASLLQFTTAKRKAKGDKVLAFGNPDLGDPKMDLKFAEVEAQEVRKLYPQSTVLLKKEATEEKGKTLSPQHDIIHFATHAELSEEDPLSSAVLLAKEGKEDGRLEVREVFGMDLKASLVVLSACETGLGKLSTGDELVGLTRAFIYAGTPSVVASLWKVEDSSTAALMASFYRNLKTMSKVEALREAQLRLIRGEGRSDLLARRGVGGIGKLGEVPEAKAQSPTPDPVSTSHPYFWAPFILVGDGK